MKKKEEEKDRFKRSRPGLESILVKELRRRAEKEMGKSGGKGVELPPETVISMLDWTEALEKGNLRLTADGRYLVQKLGEARDERRVAQQAAEAFALLAWLSLGPAR